MYGSKITLKGDWKQFRHFLSLGWNKEFVEVINKATGEAAEMLRQEIVDRIMDKEYESNALYTAISKGFSSVSEATPLVHTGTMIREGLLTKRAKEWIWKVGILGNVRSSSGLTLFELVPILHDGATIKKGNKTIRIPPRPFLKNVFDDPKMVKKVHNLWNRAIERILKKHGKL